MKKYKISILLILILISGSCENNEELYINKTAIILNENAQSLSTYNFETQEYRLDILALKGGKYPSMEYTKDSKYIFILSSGGNSLEILELTSNTIISKSVIQLPTNCSPYSGKNDSKEEFVYVSCFNSGDIYKINIETEEIVATYSKGNTLQNIWVSQQKVYVVDPFFDAGSFLYKDGYLIELNENLVEQRKLNLGNKANPNGIYVINDRGYILNTGDYGSTTLSEILEVDLVSMSISKRTSIGLGSITGLYFYRDIFYLYGFGDSGSILGYDYKTKKMKYTKDNPYFSIENEIGRSENVSGLGIYEDTVLINSGKKTAYHTYIFDYDNPKDKSKIKEYSASALASKVIILE